MIHADQAVAVLRPGPLHQTKIINAENRMASLLTMTRETDQRFRHSAHQLHLKSGRFMLLFGREIERRD
jgi:hypothetical protein